LNEHLQKEFCNTRLKLYLKCEDRCSMWHSVESRTPFADDINLIEKIFSLPSVYKIHSGKLKYLLRESARKYIPESIYNRADKMGYVTPHNTWLNELKSELTQVDFSGLEDFIDVKKINSRRNDIFHFKHQKEDFFPFKLILLAKWKKTFGM
ncbi:MAG: asparagine synthase-related protein, partial [Bacteroidota bacterium]